MTLTEISNAMVELNETIQAHETEIRYLEELLVTTSGPVPNFIGDLEREMMKLRIAQDRRGALHKQLLELQENA